MREALIERMQQRFASYAELLRDVDDTLLQQRVDVPKHKTLAEHLWCVIGARESHVRALEEGAWAGFACSLTSFGVQDFAHKLNSSAQAFARAIEQLDDWTEARDQLLLALAEHEVMHEGQIIRHMYALERTLPDSWTWA